MYNNAKTGKRFIAYFIDIFIINFISNIILSFIKPYTNALSEIGEISFRYLNTGSFTDSDKTIFFNNYLLVTAISTIVTLILFILYFVVLAHLWKKQTVGRALLHLQVVDKIEEKPTILQLILREIVGGFLILNIFSFTIIILVLYWYYSVNRGITISDMIAKTRLIDTDSYSNDLDDVINVTYNDIDEKNKEETEYKVF